MLLKGSIKSQMMQALLKWPDLPISVRPFLRLWAGHSS